VKSVDVAIDIPMNINDLKVDKMSKRIYRLHKEPGIDNYTHYIGKGYGRVKIYNKAREMGMPDMDLTRLEITLEVNRGYNDIRKYEMDSELPIVYLSSTEGLEGTLRALMYAVEEGYPMEQIPRKYKEKLRQVFKEKSAIEIDKKNIANVVIDYILGLKNNFCLN